MIWAEVRGNWLPLRDQLHNNWSDLTHEDIASIAGRRHKLIALLMLRYELDEENAAAQADEFVRALQVLSL